MRFARRLGAGTAWRPLRNSSPRWGQTRAVRRVRTQPNVSCGARRRRAARAARRSLQTARFENSAAGPDRGSSEVWPLPGARVHVTPRSSIQPRSPGDPALAAWTALCLASDLVRGALHARNEWVLDSTWCQVDLATGESNLSRAPLAFSMLAPITRSVRRMRAACAGTRAAAAVSRSAARPFPQRTTER